MSMQTQTSPAEDFGAYVGRRIAEIHRERFMKELAPVVNKMLEDAFYAGWDARTTGAFPKHAFAEWRANR